MADLDRLPVGTTAILGLALIAASLIWLAYTVVDRLFLSPLSRLPGPWLTKISSIPEINALKQNRRAAWVTSLFDDNPGVAAVRTGPKSVSFNDPEAIKAIYGHGKSADGFGKSSWYDAFSTTGESMFSTRSKLAHARKRRMVAHGFSAQSLLSFEPYVDSTIAKFMEKMDGFALTGQPFDIYQWYEYYTMDLMGELALGDNFGVLEAGKPARYSTLVEQSQRFGNLSGLLPFGKASVKVLSWVPLPYVQRLWSARVEYLEFARKALERRFLDDRRQILPSGKPRQDIMQRFIEARDPETGQQMEFDELRAETSSLMVAGASTASVTLNWLTYYLNKNLEAKARILNELEATFPENRGGKKPLPYTQLNKVRLLEYAEIECLRMHPPIGYAMPRDTPPQGAVICGVYIPGGIAVGVPAATIGRNPNVYPDPDRWDPERWSEERERDLKADYPVVRSADNAQDLALAKACFLGFGYGSRQCIGRGVATQLITKLMATLLLRYEVELENPDLVLGEKEFTIIKPDKAYNVILRPRGT